MKKIIIALIKYVISFGLGAFLIWWSLKGLTAQDKTDITIALSRARFWLLIPVFLILLTSHVFRSIRWRQMVRSMGYNPPLFHLICGLFVGYLGNQLLPRAGEILRCTVVARRNKIPAEKLLGTIIAERVVDLICLAILSVIVFFAEYNVIKQYANEIFAKAESNVENGGSSRWITILIIVAIIALCVYLLRRFRKTKWGAVLTRVAKGMWEGLVSIGKVKNKFLFILYTVLIWGSYVLSTWIGCFALQETAGLSISTGVALLIFGTVGIIIAPGGLGAYPIAIQKTLTLYNINENIGLAVGWLLWLAQFVFTIVFGTLAYIFITTTKKKK